MHSCPGTSAALARHRSLIGHSRKASYLTFPVFDAPSPFGQGSSDIVLKCCPWCAKHFPDTPPPLEAADNPNPIPMRRPGPGVHCCESMNYTLTDEDVIVIYDPGRRLYLRPIFDGSPEMRWLGVTGIVLDFCPWSGDLLPGRIRRDAIEEVPLPPGVTNPRY